MVISTPSYRGETPCILKVMETYTSNFEIALPLYPAKISWRENPRAGLFGIFSAAYKPSGMEYVKKIQNKFKDATSLNCLYIK